MSERFINPNTAGLFERSFFWWGVQFDFPPPPPLPSDFKNNVSNVDITC